MERNVKIFFVWLVPSAFGKIYLDKWGARKERNQEKDDGFWLLWGIFKEYMKQNIVMTVLEKANFHSVDICRLTKNQSRKKKIE